MATSRTHPLRTLTLLTSVFGAVCGQNGCEDCYRIDGGVIAGILVGDVFLTILIAVTIYCFTRRGIMTRNADGGQRKEGPSTPDTESPYEELHGKDRGIYSELKPNPK